MGLGQFLSVDWFLCLLWLRKDNYINIYITIITKPTTSVCASQESSDWEGGESSLVCLCHGLSTVPVYQHASSVPVWQRVIPEVSVLPSMFPGGFRSPRCPEGQDMVPLCQMAQNPQDCTYGAISFVMMVLHSFSLMWWPIGCVYHH